MKSINKKLKGFGIIEALIASTIIIIIVFSLTAVARGTMRASDNMQERAQAAQLAQEGIEVVRQIRDTNWIDGSAVTSWNSFVCTASGSALTCPALPIATANYKIVFNSLNRFSLADAGTTGELIKLGNIDGFAFKRFIKFESVGALLPDVVNPSLTKDKYSTKVTVTVTTPSGEDIAVSEMLTNWRPQY